MHHFCLFQANLPSSIAFLLTCGQDEITQLAEFDSHQSHFWAMVLLKFWISIEFAIQWCMTCPVSKLSKFHHFFLDIRHAHIWINKSFSDLCSTKLATAPLPAYYISVLDHLWRYFNNSGLLWWFWNSFKQHFLSFWPSDPSFGPIGPVFGLWRHLKDPILTTLVTATL